MDGLPWFVHDLEEGAKGSIGQHQEVAVLRLTQLHVQHAPLQHLLCLLSPVHQTLTRSRKVTQIHQSERSVR